MFVLVASRYPAREADSDKALLHVIGTPSLSSPLLTYPHLCSRMLTYAGEADSDKGLVDVMERGAENSMSHSISHSMSHSISHSMSHSMS
jgi:hypothetical protein